MGDIDYIYLFALLECFIYKAFNNNPTVWGAFIWCIMVCHWYAPPATWDQVKSDYSVHWQGRHLATTQLPVQACGGSVTCNYSPCKLLHSLQVNPRGRPGANMRTTYKPMRLCLLRGFPCCELPGRLPNNPKDCLLQNHCFLWFLYFERAWVISRAPTAMLLRK